MSNKINNDINPKKHSVVDSIKFNSVSLNDDFWLPRLKTLKTKTLPFSLEKTLPAVENLRKCGDFLKNNNSELPFPHRFISSDLYKVMEGAAYLLTIEKDEALEKRMDSIISIIEAAQKDDGYLYVSHLCGIGVEEEMGKSPYDYVLHSHELYNMGHLYEGAVAYYLATGKKNWLNVAEKNANHINKVFFVGDNNYNDGIPVNQAPGHQEIEIGLCKLYMVTKNNLYLNMAKRFLDIRGVTFTLSSKLDGVMSPTYAQQHLPVSEQKTAVGHAVRAGYMYSSMADVAGLMNDNCYDDALDNIWKNITNTKMHITGGLGAIHGIEGFGDEYDLPNKEAYNETCAAIANVFFNYKMFLRYGDAKYFDVAEVALFNNSLAGVNLSGDRFFYVNPLESDGHHLFNHGNAGRAPWFDCACCPSNIARLIPQISGYMYAKTKSDIICLLYSSNTMKVEINNEDIEITQKTDYPFDGKILFTINLNKPTNFNLKLRIPTWTTDRFVPGTLYSYIDDSHSSWNVKLNDKKINSIYDKGFISIDRNWNNGDIIELDLPMPIRYSTCDKKVVANNDRIAITRGPLVYCAEEVDNFSPIQQFYFSNKIVKESTNFEKINHGPLKNMITLTVPAKQWLDNQEHESRLKLIPYFSWNNRGNSSMNVWISTNIKKVKDDLEKNTYSSDKFGKVTVSSCKKNYSSSAIIDGNRPQSSNDTTIPWWVSEVNNKNESVELRFFKTQIVNNMGVYWAHNSEDVNVPKEWKLYYLKDDRWNDFKLYVTDFFGVERNMYTVVHPSAKLSCDGLKLVITPINNKSIGILDIDLQVE